MKELTINSKSVSENRAESLSEPLSLHGIYGIRGINKAIISSKTVAEGDRIDNFVVQKIYSTKVKLISIETGATQLLNLRDE